MWPSIPAFNPFGEVSCPAGARCEIPYCIFSHHQPVEDRLSKRIKLEEDAKTPAKPDNPATPASKPHSVFVGSLSARPVSEDTTKVRTQSTPVPAKTPVQTSKDNNGLPRSATRTISPPRKPAPKAKPDVPVPLTPRKISKEPAQFAKRLALLKVLRSNMALLNEKVAKDPNPDIKAFKLTENQLNKLAVDEEEKTALGKGIYENTLKQRIMMLKKMHLAEWVRERKAAVDKEQGTQPAPPPPKVVETGLTPKQEVMLLSKMLMPLDGLDQYGYVTKIPSLAEVDEMRLVLNSADHWEKCDRCNTRFQVFPDRRQEDGALTTGGPCKHHWGKKNPQGKKVQGVLPELTWSCCQQPLGSPPCTTYHTHVFKVKASDIKRLALIMPFIKTPENDQADPHTAVSFDCEMGYTTLGLELMRLTAISWPSHKPILDILVRPLGKVLDVNTRFSGITPEQFIGAKPYDPENPSVDPKDLRIVDSPYVARDLFTSLISPMTPLVGHALENDLNAIRLIHPTLVDTVYLYPHPRGLPARLGLRSLASQYLQMHIQQAGAAGHDSYEDAKATGELVRFRAAEVWKRLRIDGWTISDEGIHPPLPPGEPPLPPGKPPLAPAQPSEQGVKRPLEESEGEDDGKDEAGTHSLEAKRRK